MSTSLSTDLEVAADELRFAQRRLDQFVPKEELERAVEAAKDNLANVATLKQCTVSSSIGQTSPVQPAEEVDPFESKSTPTSADYSRLNQLAGPWRRASADDQFGVEENPLDPADETHPQKPSLATDLPNGHSGVWNHTEYGKQD